MVTKEQELSESTQIRPTTSEGGCPLGVSDVNGPEADAPLHVVKKPAPEPAATDVKEWYVMRVSYGRGKKAGDYLRSIGIECYAPVSRQKDTFDKDGNRIVVEQSILPNNVFVRGTSQEVYDLKHRMPGSFPLRYEMDHTKHPHAPMIIPDKMMTDFIEVTSTRNDSLLWLDHPADVFTKGRRVRVIHGPLKGREGYILRIKHDRRLVLSLAGLASAAVMSIECRFDWMEPIE